MIPLNDINEELIALGSPLAGLSRTMPYFIPDGYFTHSVMQAHEDATYSELSDPELTYPTSLPYHVPEDYFIQLPSSLLQDAVYSEAEEPHLLFSRNNVFVLPNNYFNTFPATALEDAKVQDLEEPALHHSKEMTFAVPDGYFKALPEELLLIASADIQAALTPHVAPFSVPQGYFKNLPEQLLLQAKLSETSPAATGSETKLEYKPTTRIFRFRNVMKLAVAAMLVMGIGFAGLKMLPKQANAVQAPFNLELALSQVDKSEIRSYVEQNIDEFDMETLETEAGAHTESESLLSPMPNLNDNEINAYLNEMGEI